MEVNFLKNEVLNDSNLEKLNVIKEIDTISIINKADEIIKKRERKRINIIGITICILLIMVNVMASWLLGVKKFFILQIFILWISPIFIVLFIKGLTMREGVKWRQHQS